MRKFLAVSPDFSLRWPADTNVIFSVADRRIPPSARSRTGCAATISPDQGPPPAVHTAALSVGIVGHSERAARASPARRRKRHAAGASTAKTASEPVIGESDPVVSTQARGLSEPDALPALEPRSPDVVEAESADEPTQSGRQPAPDPPDHSIDDHEPAQTVAIEYAAGFAFARPKPFVFRR